MKTIKFILLIAGLLNVRNFTLEAQVQLGLFSYSEFFYAPKESHYGAKTIKTGYNKSNLSSSLGISFKYKINNKFSIYIEGQRINRDFDCDCINVIVSLSNIYYIGTSPCDLQLASTYKIFQIPMLVSYSFPTNGKITHSISAGNTLVYSLKRKNLLYDNIGSLEVTSIRKTISVFSPEVRYDLSAYILNHTYANLSFGIREELSNQVNHAFFAKVGMSYSFEKDKPKRRRRR
jgi:hypothetical protein